MLAFVKDADVFLAETMVAGYLLPKRQGHGAKDTHLQNFWHRREMHGYGASGVAKVQLPAQHALVFPMDFSIFWRWKPMSPGNSRTLTRTRSD
jgi:hypothetical protein